MNRLLSIFTYLPTMSLKYETLAPVAQPEQLLSANESNPQYNNKTDFKLLLLNDNINLKKNSALILGILTKYESILGSAATRKAFMFFLEQGASTIPYYIASQNVIDQTAYRVVRRLKKEGIIQPVYKIKTSKQGGPKSTVYGLVDCTQQEIQFAVANHNRLNNVLYKQIEYVYQLTLSDVENQAIQYMKIVNLARRHSAGFAFIDVADETAKKLTLEGIKVWR